MATDIQKVIEAIDEKFSYYNRDKESFTVDYDENTDGLYCHYTPFINDRGFSVTDDLLIVSETSQDDLEVLTDYLNKNKITSRPDCDWDVKWGHMEKPKKTKKKPSLKVFTFQFYIADYPAKISVVAETKGKADKQIRSMIDDHFFDAGLTLTNTENYHGE